MPEVALEEGELEEIHDLLAKSRRNAMPGDRRADYHRGKGEIRSDEPREVRVDAQEDRHPIEVEQKCEGQPEDRVKAQERREPEEHAQRKRGRGAFRGVLDVQKCAHPTAGELE